MHEEKNNIIISGIILTFNQANNINNCLKSLVWCNEIIIVDSYSTDQTVEVVKKYTDKIYYRKFDDDFAKQREFAISKAKGEWILVLDADETLPKGAGEIIRKIIKDNNADAFLFPRRNYINEKTYLQHGYFYPDWQLRLFRRKKFIRYNRAVHEYPSVRGNIRKIRTIEIYHNPSKTKYDSFLSFKRFFPYIKIEGKKIAETKESSIRLFSLGIRDIIRDFYWSFIRDQGYKDGIAGFRAALLYSFYRGTVSFYAIFTRIRRIL
uniref:Glycosyltransferase family 2 protein n=1 Tax=candidate division CPR3 bacterium TaxID=2268181 RepID=A0A7C4R540_UNCC3